VKYFLTIAASDNSGGAGIQQDIKIAHDLGYWALSAITGITAQNFKKVLRIEAVDASLLRSQIEQCCTSFPVNAIKIGAICSLDNIKVIAYCLKKYTIEHIVLDTVLSSTSGKKFLNKESLNVLKKELFPLTELITPNKPEFEILTDTKFDTIEEGIEIAKSFCIEWHTSILLKGGHFSNAKIKEALITKDYVYCFERERIKFNYEHGTGCTLSSALACFLGNNMSFQESYTQASEYLVKLYNSLKYKML